jgi:hypothetical protein
MFPLGRGNLSHKNPTILSSRGSRSFFLITRISLSMNIGWADASTFLYKSWKDLLNALNVKFHFFKCLCLSLANCESFMAFMYFLIQFVLINVVKKTSHINQICFGHLVPIEICQKDNNDNYLYFKLIFNNQNHINVH